MKLLQQGVFVLSVLCLFPAADSIAASGATTGLTPENDSKMNAPLAEMMLYEAAEQAVEDGYAEIIPEPENTTGQEAADIDNKRAEEENIPSGTELRDNKE